MGVAVGLILVAFGAILTWAVNAHVSGIDVTAVGVILLVLGIIVVIFDFLWWRSWTWATQWRQTTYVEGAPAPRAYTRWPPRRRVVIDEEVPGPGAPGPPGPPPP